MTRGYPSRQPSRIPRDNNTGSFHRRTYAAVVRQGTRHEQKRFFRDQFLGPRQREDRTNKNNWIPPDDPLFGPQLRKFYKVIQLVHHLRNVTPTDNKTDTKLISHMVEELASLIKPASPTPETLELIMGNAKNWGFNTLLILQDHYKDQLDKALLTVWNNCPRNWKQALQVAKAWAKRRLTRIKHEVLDHAEALIISCQPQDNDTTEDRPEQTRNTVPQPTRKETRNTTTQTVPNNTIETQTEIHTQTQTETSTQHPQHSTTKQDTQTPQTTNTGTMTDPYREWSPLTDTPPRDPPSPKTQRSTVRIQLQRSVVHEAEPVTDQTQHSGDTPKETKQQDRRCGVGGPSLFPRTPAPKGGEVILPTQGVPGDADQRQDPPEPLSLMDLTIRDMDAFFDIDEDADSDSSSDKDDNYKEARNSTFGPRAPEDTPLPEIEEFSSDPDMPPLESLPEDDDPQEDHDPEGPELEFLKTFNLSFQDTSITTSHKVHKHIHTKRKMLDWSLNVHKKWLFLGDSNLAQFPPYTIEDLQIDSFPGANFRHITEVIGKATVHVTVEKTILAFGINSRTQKPKETTVRQIQAAIRVVKQIFPYSEIYIPLINFSTDLPIREQENLREVNKHIEKNMPSLPKLEDSLFETIPDRVHWTKTTAIAIFDHWVKYLNLRLPRAS